MYEFIDMHMHPGFADDAAAFANSLMIENIAGFANTISPLEYRTLSPLIGNAANMRLGIGIHPWEIGKYAEDSLEMETAYICEQLSHTCYVGEIGLDFLPKHIESKGLQLRVFETIAGFCGSHGGYVISIHSVNAETVLLDILENTRCVENCTCILHSFSGNTEELWRAVDLGCLFSMGPLKLNTKKGREYCRILPQDKLLFETDLPEKQAPGTGSVVIRDELETTLNCIAELRTCDAKDLQVSIALKSMEILHM